MVIRNLEDIEREKNLEKREKFKKEISGDINDVLGNVFGKPKKRKSFLDYLFSFLKWVLILLGVVVVVNLVFGNIWLLKFFIKDFFMNLLVF
ncbi:hypothetical protein HOD75_05080 [archaeon]|jgi:hypothetical protein|nr:hypothetical protein [Candidatus Woesearchaeota archaeon]MBT4135879.1 hypothetical protein [archaeon]MBT4242239.1 hypothetical protein [archaeon]MBT4417927.1 hypothetical protein [archaeon]